VSLLYVFICTKTTADAALPTTSYNQNDFNRRVSNTFRAFNGGRLVCGDLKLRPTANAVANHLLCDGSEISRTQFPELFRLLGESEGAGDGTSTFNLPNYLGSALEIPDTAPAQTITEHGTIASPVPVTEPMEPGEIGGTEGGNVLSGGQPAKIDQ
jgi:hypothetical protein